MTLPHLKPISCNLVHEQYIQIKTIAQHSKTSMESTYVSQAISNPQWLEAMSSELIALMRHGTWDLVPLPTNCTLVECK